MWNSQNSERWVKLLFATVIVLFPLQYWFAKCVTEPYPALLLPGFEGGPVNAADQVSIETADVSITFFGGKMQVISLRSLFADAPSSQFQVMAYYALYPKPGGVPPADLWSNARWKRLIPWRAFPGFTQGKIRRQYWSGVESATVEWVRGKMIDLFPAQTVERVDVIWYNATYSERNAWKIAQRTPGPRVEIKL